MIRTTLALLLLWPLLANGAPEVRLRTQLLQAEQLVPGSTLTLQVDVLVDTWFTAPPQLPKLEVDGAVVSPPGGEAVHLNEEEQGKRFFGLRFNYQITAQQAGEFAVPALTVRTFPGQSDVPVEVSTTPQRFSVGEGNASPGGQALLVASQVEMAQRLARSHERLRVGDTVTRYLSVRALGGQAMLIPAPDFAQVKGLGRYVQPPVVAALDDGRGGAVGGRREDAVVYRILKEGEVRLPAISLDWWSAADSQAHRVSVPAVVLKVDAAPVQATAFSLEDDLKQLRRGTSFRIGKHWLLWLGLLLTGAALVYVGRAWGRPALAALHAWHERRRQAWEASQAYAWRLAKRQANGQAPQLGGLYLWARRRFGRPVLGPVFAEPGGSGSDSLQQCLASLYGPAPTSHPASAIAQLLAQAKPVRKGPSPPRSDRFGLKPLNPTLEHPSYARID